MARERRGHTLQPTALINEVYLRLVDWRAVRWQDRAHFFGIAAGLMRRTLVDYARRHHCSKRRSPGMSVSLEGTEIGAPQRTKDLVAIDDALSKLASLDPRKGRVIELRFFAGLNVEETAEVLNVSPRTVKREWSLARAWLYCELGQEETAGRQQHGSAP